MISNIQMLQAFSAQLTDMQKLADRLIKNLGPKAKKEPKKLKLKWLLNDETYRIARRLTDGRVLQLKSVTDGGGDCHNDDCRCVPCREIALSGGVLPPWRRARPLNKTYFADEYAWLKSLPQNEGQIVEY
jgi:hypothetical protein